MKIMASKAFFNKIAEIFEREMPIAETELDYNSPFQLLIAVILSAQCTDKRINTVTPKLFDTFPTPETLAEASTDDVFELIKSVSYPNNKAKHLVGMAQKLCSDFGGNVPSDLDALISLPGVGRKTANVIQAVIYNKPTMAVDTHVFRVSHRIGLVEENATTPLAVESALTKGFAKDIIPKAHHWLILHGRYVCTARNPKCSKCFLSQQCHYYRHNFE